MKDLNDYIDLVQKNITYRFENLDLLRQAFTRSSYSKQYGSEDNEVLEFLGDKILDFIVIKIISEVFGFLKEDSTYYDPNTDFNEFCLIAHKNEANFTELKKEIVSNKTLAQRIDELELVQYMYLGDADIDNNVINQTKVKADLFEAIIGAVAIDCKWNVNILEDVVSNMLQIEDFFEDVDNDEEKPPKFKIENAINTLKEMAEHGLCSFPEYYIPDEQVLNHDGNKVWQCTCIVRSLNLQITTWSNSKKNAKKIAAYSIICDYYHLPNEYDIDGGND